ncbi:hypothetical protein LIER_07622 [Lithospermum erythrorhizon]|uniref:Uncharacterized protein n=1 Tax=Lithospermum erythrorhizon TaxID=34254 RepID=A0AAV3PBN8_LITER
MDETQSLDTDSSSDKYRPLEENRLFDKYRCLDKDRPLDPRFIVQPIPWVFTDEVLKVAAKSMEPNHVPFSIMTVPRVPLFRRAKVVKKASKEPAVSRLLRSLTYGRSKVLSAPLVLCYWSGLGMIMTPSATL